MSSKVPERAGAAHEQEDTRPFSVPIDRALAALAAGGCTTARPCSACNGSRSTARGLPRSCARRRAMSAILVAVEGPQAGDWLAALRAQRQGP